MARRVQLIVCLVFAVIFQIVSGYALKLASVKLEEQDPLPLVPFFYEFGHRTNGDRILGYQTAHQIYQQPKDASFSLRYPYEPWLTFSAINYVEININQTSNIGRAIIVSGDIGQKEIAIIVEGRQTIYFSFAVKFYGH